jgi:hypothetical protein
MQRPTDKRIAAAINTFGFEVSEVRKGEPAMGEIIELSASWSDSQAGLSASWTTEHTGNRSPGFDWRPAA